MGTDIKVKVNAKDLQEVGSRLGLNVLQIKDQLNVLRQLPSKIDGHWACTTWDTLRGTFYTINEQMGTIIDTYDSSATDLGNAAEEYNKVEKSNEALLDECFPMRAVIK